LLVALVITSMAPLQPTHAQAPVAQRYSAGDASIDQTWLPRRNAQRKMPYRVEGIIAAPEGAGPFPIVFILHGAHGGCPTQVNDAGVAVEQWPCAPDVEQRNDAGLSYLAEALAARGYVAIAPNLNAVYAQAYGAVSPELRRYPDVLDAHLQLLIAANTTITTALGINLQGRLDLNRIGMAGHGHGALLTMQSARARAERRTRRVPTAGAPLFGALLLAPQFAAGGDIDMPLGIVLPECDGETPELNGQAYYEDARLRTNRNAFAASLYLRGASHNAFNNAVQSDDATKVAHVPGCGAANLLTPAAQQQFLAQYAPDFFDAALGNLDNAARAGLSVNAPPPNVMFDVPVQTALAAGAGQRGIVIAPRSRDDLGYNGFGGFAKVTGPARLDFCDSRAPCTRWPLQPGNPTQLRFSWNDPISVKWEMPLGETPADLSPFTALHFRVVPDPSDFLNAHRKPLGLNLTLIDVNDRSAVVRLTAQDVAAFAYPPGRLDVSSFRWLGHAFLGSVRVPLAQFAGIDLAQVKTMEIQPAGPSTVSGQAASGALFMADLEFVR
jgi:dienelactone hydrolase